MVWQSSISVNQLPVAVSTAVCYSFACKGGEFDMVFTRCVFARVYFGVGMSSRMCVCLGEIGGQVACQSYIL